MSRKTEIKVIPSPYKVVTQYEKEFIDAFSKNVSEAVADVLKYVAKATASAIKADSEETKTDEK